MSPDPEGVRAVRGCFLTGPAIAIALFWAPAAIAFLIWSLT